MRKSLGLMAAAVVVAAAAAVAVSRAEPPATAPPTTAPPTTAPPTTAPPTTAPAASEPAPRAPASPDDVARGKALFTGTCAAYCHRTSQPEGAASAAGGDAPNLFGCDWRHGGSDEQIFHTISAGVPSTRMVPFGGAIPDEDIWRIVAYLKSATQCKTTP
jgi:mono/diheme cytochrome c family protein